MRGRLRVAGLFAAVTLVLAGCGLSQTHFTDRDGGRAYLLAQLKQKYGRDFTLKSESFGDSGGATFFSGRVYPVGHPEQEAGARVTKFGELTDNWGVYPFADRMVVQPRQVCAQQARAIKKCEVRPRVPTSSTYWDPAMPVEQFVAKSNAANDVVVELVATDERQMAPVILDLIDRLDAGPVTYVLIITRGGEPNVVLTHSKNQPRPTLQWILDTIP